MSYILALDQGTTSSRALLFDRGGQIVATAQQEFEQIFPQPGWVEHDPRAIWQSQLQVAQQAIEQAGTVDQIAAIGIANQRETTIVWHRQTGEPIANAIVWQDRRTAGLCAQLRERGLEPMFQERTGLLLDPYFSGTKLHWILENIAGAREKAQAGELAFGTVDSWLLWNLTGGKVHATDISNASRTLLLNIHEGDWDDQLLEALDIPRAMLPTVRGNSEIFGETSPDLFGKPIAIAGMAGDQQAALFGQMCTRPGMAKNTYGTGCFLLLNTGEKAVQSEHKLLTTVAWKIGDRTEYALEGSIFMAGAIVQWLRDGLGVIQQSADVQALAASVPDNGGVYLVPAFAGLGAPHWDPGARGTILGLTRGSTAGHIARAALEAIALQVADVLEAMHQDAGVPVTELRADGGASRDDLLMQIQADLLGVPIVRPKVTETTAAGAAYLAGLAVGFWDSTEQIAEQWQVDARYEPRMGREAVDHLRRQWQRAVERSRQWAVDER